MLQLINPVCELLLGFILTAGNPPGSRFASISMTEWNIGFILTALIIILASWIMAEGCKLLNEQQLTILSILKTGKAKAIRFSTLDAICQYLACEPGDILEYSQTANDSKDLYFIFNPLPFNNTSDRLYGCKSCLKVSVHGYMFN